MKKYILYPAALLTLISCGGNPQGESSKTNMSEMKTSISSSDIKRLSPLAEKAKSIFGELPSSADVAENPSTEAKVMLGKALFHDKRLSKDNTVSCNSCHNLNTYGVDNKKFSEGNDKQLGGRNSPTVLNAAFHVAQFWDGRAKDVEEQAGGPILNPAEMAIPNKDFLVKRLSGIKEYKDLFANAFPGDKKPITYENIQKSIGSFERKLVTPSRFDNYLKGDTEALNDKEKAGLLTFINTGCTACHNGNTFGGNMFQKFGLHGNYWEYTKSEKVDMGKYELTKNNADKYFFKVPSLRNVAKTAPYFHDGSIRELKSAVGIMAKLQLNKKLTDKERNDIVAFLGTLTGEVPKEYKETFSSTVAVVSFR